MNEVQVSPLVALDGHPDVMDLHKELDVPNTPGSRVYGDGWEAMAVGYRFLVKMAELNLDLDKTGPPTVRGRRKVVHAGRVHHLHGKEPELASGVKEGMTKVLASMDRKLEAMQRGVDTLESRVASALDHPDGKSTEGAAVATQIRTHVAALPDTKRLTFLLDAIKKREDRVTTAAVLSAPAFLSGLTDKQQEMVRADAATRWAPGDFAQLTESRKAILRVRQARERVERECGKYIALGRSVQGDIAKKAKEQLANG